MHDDEGPAIDVAESPAHVGPWSLCAWDYSEDGCRSHEFLVCEGVLSKHRDFIDSILIGTETLRPSLHTPGTQHERRTIHPPCVVLASALSSTTSLGFGGLLCGLSNRNIGHVPESTNSGTIKYQTR